MSQHCLNTKFWCIYVVFQCEFSHFQVIIDPSFYRLSSVLVLSQQQLQQHHLTYDICIYVVFFNLI